jgi:2-amino-4-hydroxy-6-hydroxymethyldihydropteridine diphosphokinase
MKRRSSPLTAYVAFGSNRGPRRSLLERALRALGETPGVRLERVSPLYRTDPVGGPKQPPFLNGVARLRTRLAPAALLASLLAIERSLGRRRAVRWGPRRIDLDLVALGARRSSTPTLTLPHPRYHERRFVLAPLADIAPRFRHPRLGRTPAALLRRLPPGSQRVTMVGTWTKSRFQLFSRKRKPANRSSR